jgi:hypothetical protein
MIITAILNLVYVFLGFILSPLSLLGDVSLNSNFASSLATASGYYHALNGILPMDTMLAILGVSLAFEGAYLIFKLIMWIIAKIPMLN